MPALNLQKLLLICGILSSALYIFMDVTAAAFVYPGYDYSSQQVSELSAIGAPSRDFWMAMGYPYFLLTIAFGAGVALVSHRSIALRMVSVLIVLFAINGVLWGLLAPMHMRGAAFTDTDTMHIAFAVSAVLLMLVFMGLGAAALGRGFRVFTALLVAAMLIAGGVVSTQVPAIAANQPTPWMGLVERISVYAPMLWIAVFAVQLWPRAESDGRKAPQLSR